MSAIFPLPPLADLHYFTEYTWFAPAFWPLRPPIIDRDPGDEERPVRIRVFSTLFGNARTCHVCWSVTDWCHVWLTGDSVRCRCCRSALDERFVPVTFTRKQLYGAGS